MVEFYFLSVHHRLVHQVYATTDQVRGIPRSLEGIPVVVKVTDEFVALSCNRDEYCPRPVPLGVSTGHPNITAGTIGCRVTDGTNVYALSNNHVYANENAGPIGVNVLQPGPYDGGINPDDAIGTLAKFEKIVFSTSANNVIDAAIASSDLVDKSTIHGCYGTPKTNIVLSPPLRMRVKKCGRTTGLTKGKIEAINATVNIQYDSGVARFVNQIVIGPSTTFSAAGDSGSLIVANGGINDRKPVALLFAGSSLYTIGNPINVVLSAFGVTVDGEP